ncbi:hypothetical protein AK812_SmicGene34669 [Symbiodinium microadriaticum]|uniref:Uncharacterized protein n=1 Tax=Symbiodinium microadriaticum TaxID=2951 RepID=A0A1Q9CNF3_SYMMI|nr:hypothetical protein AK812_SmicGene34669 [Symbiodinium microadriaticum]
MVPCSAVASWILRECHAGNSVLTEDSGLLLKKADLAERSVIHGGIWVEEAAPKVPKTGAEKKSTKGEGFAKEQPALNSCMSRVMKDRSSSSQKGWGLVLLVWVPQGTLWLCKIFHERWKASSNCPVGAYECCRAFNYLPGLLFVRTAT